MKTHTIIAFDFGTRWIGCAAGQTLTGTATPLPALRARDGIPDWEQLGKLLEEWKPTTVVVGLPLNMDDSESELSARARKFANRIHGRFGLPVEHWDERLSSFEAKGEILEQRHSKQFKREGVDSLSAQLILESWLRSQTS